MLHRLTLLAAVAGCGSSPAERQPAFTTSASRGDDRAEYFHIRAAPLGDRLIDATFDQQARGGRPSPIPPPSVEGGIRVTLGSLVPEAQQCFAGSAMTSVGVRFTVTPTGQATDVRVESDEHAARDCLKKAIASAAYPLTPRGRAWRVQYVFRL